MSISILKKLALLCAVLIAVWAVYLYRQVPRHQAPFQKHAESSERIVIEQGPKTLEFQKQGGRWKVGVSSGPWYAADENHLKVLVNGLKSIQLEDEISNRADRAPDFDVTSEKGTRVRLLDGKGAVLSEGLFGKQAPDMTHMYFRFIDKPNVYLARGMSSGELGGTQLNPWRSRDMIDIPEDKIQGILIEGKGFKTDLVRVSTDAWAMNGGLVDSGLVNGVVGIIAHLRADDFVDPITTPEQNFDRLTFARVTLKGADSVAEIRIGALDKKTLRYPVSVARDQGLVWISQPAIDSFLKKPGDFKSK